MPAYFESGFSVREPMWHGLGTVLDSYPESWDEARLAAGLLWEPTQVPVWTERPSADVTCTDCKVEFGGNHHPACPKAIDAEEAQPVTAIDCGASDAVRIDDDRVFVKVDSHAATVRDDTRAVLGVTSADYSIIGNGQMGELLEAVLDVETGVKFETAGSVRGGQQVYALAYLDEPYTVPGDESETYPYLAFLNSHDGAGACKVLPTQVRVVCWNTFNAASMAGDRTGRQVVIRHVGNVAERIEEAKRMLAGLREEVKAWQVMAADLTSIRVDDAFVRTFAEEFIPTPDNPSERIRNDRAERRAVFTKLYDSSPTMDGVRGTAYGVVQAAGEYLDHLRPFRSRDTYLTRTMFRPEPVKAGVLTLVRDLAAAAN